MKIQELHRDVMIEMVRAAAQIACVEIETLGSNYNRNANFFDLALGDVVAGVEKRLLKEKTQ